MGWNDHMDDDNELGNLPPEAFSPWNIDGPFDPPDNWLRTASQDEQRIAVRAWFSCRYCDPANNRPYDGGEGGYQFVRGEPYDPADIVPARFSGVVKDDVIQQVVDELHGEVGDEWAAVPPIVPNDYDEDYGVVVDSRDQPFKRLRDRLVQSRQILTLQGDIGAQTLARSLVFASVITSLESFLWETVTYWVDQDDTIVANMVTQIPQFRDQPLTLGGIFERFKNLKNEIKAYLQNLVWHQWNKVAPLFKQGLKVDIPGLKQFENALIKRHDIVHRSGFSKDGKRVDVDVPEIEALCEQIIAFASKVNAALATRNSQPLAVTNFTRMAKPGSQKQARSPQLTALSTPQPEHPPPASSSHPNT